MKILILGAGQVGGTLAEHLSNEQNDITLIDSNTDRLRELQDKLDIGTVAGQACYPEILRKAGAEDTDLLIAVTNSDEINMVACQIAYSMFNIPKIISRIRSQSYINRPELFSKEIVPIDVLISPEQLVTSYIESLLQHPGTLQVLDFADGRIRLVAVKAVFGGPLVGQELQQLREHMPNVDTRVAAIFRRDHPIQPTGETVIEAGDEVFFIAAHNHIVPVMSEMRRLDNPYKRIMIAGGGNIGLRLASAIEDKYHVKLIEYSYDRCKQLSELLTKSIVLHGSASDSELLIAESIEDVDVFCALTNDDEANIMASLLAKRLGARKVITLITNPAYVDLVQGGDIDIALSPQQITIGSLLTHVRKGDVAAVHSLRRGAAEALELIAHGDEKSSKVVGKRIDKIDLPPGVTIGALMRDDKVLIAHSDVVIESDDRVIVFVTNKKHVKEVEKLFAVAFSFF
jgi:trk system potassium uptake protein TrkA